MIYWKTIEAANYKEYSKYIMSLFYKDRDNVFQKINTFWNPIKQSITREIIDKSQDLLDLENFYGEINEIAVLVLHGDTSTLHVDHTYGPNKGVKARLNIPVFNCENTVTAFFKMSNDIYKLHSINAGGTKFWPDALRYELTPITTVSLIKPTILRTSEPHTVFCPEKSSTRIALTISFKEDLVRFLA